MSKCVFAFLTRRLWTQKGMAYYSKKITGTVPLSDGSVPIVYVVMAYTIFYCTV